LYRAVDTVYLDLSGAFETASHNILLEKQMKYSLDEQTVKWIENWLNDWARRVVISGMKST